MKIFLAGTFGEKKDIDIVKQSDYILESFFYFKDWQTDLLATTKDFLLDSGAYTFIQGKSGVDWNDYIDKYSFFVRSNDIKHYFELDIDSIVGYEKVKKFRKELEHKTQKQVIPVWHRNRGIEDYKRMCEEYNYIAIGGLAIKEIVPSEYKILPYLIDEAHKRGTIVHGLGFTKVSQLHKYHFDSVDSTRWNCARFGRLEYFDGKTIRSVDKRKDGLKLKGRSECDSVRYSLQEWIKFQKWAETHL